MPCDSGPLQSPNPVTETPLFMSDSEDANDHGDIDERDRTREPPEGETHLLIGEAALELFGSGGTGQRNVQSQ